MGRKKKLEPLTATQKQISDNTFDIKDKIRELIHKYKYNASASTVVLYEELMKELEELIK